MSDALLSLDGVHTHIGQYHILQGVDLAVPRGELTVLLGRNGAGKTTTLRTIMGLWPPLSRPAGSCQKRLSAGNSPKIQSSRAASGGPRRAASRMFSATVRSANTPMLSGT